MLRPLKNLLRGGRVSPAPDGTSPAVASGRSVFPLRNGTPAAVSTRPSRGLDQFFGYIRGQSGLTILDRV